MPPLEEHLVISRERTGRDHAAVHAWLDSDPEKKAERHDPVRIPEFGAEIEAQHGGEALVEYIQHVIDDIWFPASGGEAETAGGAPADAWLLIDTGVSLPDIAHSVKVAEKAVEIAGRVGRELDMELVARGALFHDLGKARTHEIEHGNIGSRLGAEQGLSWGICDVMEKHIRGGLTGAEARELGLPDRDYTLIRLEERVIIYADRLVDIITEDVVVIGSELQAEAWFVEILERFPRYGKDDLTLKRYLGYHREIQDLMVQQAAAAAR